MHPTTRKLFLYHVALMGGMGTQLVEAKSAYKGTVSLSYMARLYTMRKSASGNKIKLENKYNKVEFEVNSRRCWINGVMVWLQLSSKKSGSNLSIQEVDFKTAIDPILRSYAYVPKKAPRLVVIDPGHGGKDSGANGKKKVQEKVVVLDISNRVKALLEAKGIAVRLTRTGDTYPTLDQRTDYAARVGADVFISIHADGAGDPSAHGVETFITTSPGYDSSNHFGKPGDKSSQRNNQFDPSNAILGFSIQSNLVKMSKRSDRGLRRARFSVTKKAPCPAALVECGFLTNPAEEALLNSPSYRANVARGIANGVLGYFTLVNRARK